MRMAIGVAQLISDGVDEQVASFGVEVDGQTLENIHIRRVPNGRHGRRQPFSLNRLDGLCANVEDQCVQQRQIVMHSGLRRHLSGGRKKNKIRKSNMMN